MKLKTLLAALVITLAINNTYAQKVANGIWRGVLKTQAGKEIPFNFNVKNVGGKQQVIIINADERLKADALIYKGDSAIIKLPFGSEFR